MDRKLTKYCEISGVKKIKMHELRHSHTSLLASMNTKPTAISKRLGHSNTEITLKTYTHMFPSDADEAVQSLNKFRKKGDA